MHFQQKRIQFDYVKPFIYMMFSSVYGTMCTMYAYTSYTGRASCNPCIEKDGEEWLIFITQIEPVTKPTFSQFVFKNNEVSMGVFSLNKFKMLKI